MNFSINLLTNDWYFDELWINNYIWREIYHYVRDEFSIFAKVNKNRQIVGLFDTFCLVKLIEKFILKAI
jgi:hypothetical protein